MSEIVNASEVPIYTVSVPQYRAGIEPDDKAIGKVLDDELRKHFDGQEILFRYVASAEHPDKSIDELIDIIKETGTDRYNSTRVGDRYDNREGKHIDIFACQEKISEATIMSQTMIWGFYHSAIAVHGRPFRIDIISIYDPEQLERVYHQYEGRDDIKDDGYAFRNPSRKAVALKAIIKIL